MLKQNPVTMSPLYRIPSLVFLLTGLSSLTAFGQQKPLTPSCQTSYYTYIYKLSPEAVLSFYKYPNRDFDEKQLHNPIDSFKTGTYWDSDTLKPGNYVKVYAEKNSLHYQLIEKHSAELKVIDNKYDLRLTFVGVNGMLVNNAHVWTGGHEIPFDEKSGSYHTRFSKDDMIIRADYAGVPNFFLIKRDSPDHFYDDLPNWLHTRWNSIKRLFKKKWHPIGYEGFIVFNKPKYKPNDTVRFKAFIIHKGSKKPISDAAINVVLNNRSGKKLLATVNRYNKGAFEYSFVLNDSLKLELDNAYELFLEKPSSKNDDNNYNSYNRPNKRLLMIGRFRYEDYDLKSVKFHMRADKTKQIAGIPFAIYLSAADENGLPVADGRVTLRLVNPSVTSYLAPHVFVPDTLWVHQVNLDPIGETKVIIPDSIFPKASFNYDIEANFLNSNNESHTETTSVSYFSQRFNINASLVNDSLVVSYLDMGKPTTAKALISSMNANDDTLTKTTVTLPAITPINPNVSIYNIETDSVEYDVELKEESPNLSVSGERTADSLFVQVTNPRRIHFWYSVFAANKLIDQGNGTGDFFYRKAYNRNKLVTFMVNYIWGGKENSEKTEIAYQDKLLTVNVKQPATVYPGQQVTSVVVVTDNKGRPVPNTDLTAWSLTKKFENYYSPTVPYLGISYKRRKEALALTKEDVSETGTINLNWKRWGTEMRLDSIAYFQFTHPAPVYRIEENNPDNITQIAPFVIKNGAPDPIHILYIDERPVYFSQAQQEQHYSFRVTPGKHLLRFRTLHANIKMDSVFVEKSKKLILSVNEDSVKATKESDTLSYYESNLLNGYMIQMDNNFGTKMALLQQGDNLVRVNTPFVYNNGVLTGPLAENYATLSVQGKKPMNFMAEAGYSYLFLPGLLKQKSMVHTVPIVLSKTAGADNYGQYVLTQAAADSTWQQFLDFRSNSQILFNNTEVFGKDYGRLILVRDGNKANPTPFIKNVILYRYNDLDFVRIYPGSITDFDRLPKGKYRALFLLKNNYYDLKENIEVKAAGFNYYKFFVKATHRPDSLSIKINKVIENRTSASENSDFDIENDALKIKEAFNDRYLDTHNLTNRIAGTVIGADDKQPVIGCTVKLKGTSYGVVTDTKGRFVLNVAAPGSLVVSYIGYQTSQVSFRPGEDLKIALVPTSSELREVVVVGYGSVRKKDLAYAVASITTIENNYTYQALQGKVAGIGVFTLDSTSAPGTIMLRGFKSVEAGKSPLFIIDGVPMTSMGSISPGSIANITILKDAAATALYGAQAANGAIIIVTKKSTTSSSLPDADISKLPAGEQKLRKNFSDYAYWQPKLVTDAEGKAGFTTTFPDDITNWRTFVIAINAQKQVGFHEAQIKSFRPVSANLVSPQFAVRGDQMNVIGKVMNYTAENVKTGRSFSYNGKLIINDTLSVKNAHIDTMSVTAEGTDSLTFEYSIKRDNGYFDGEMRKIPLVEQGTEETKGIFAALEKDTTVNMKFDPGMGPVTFRAEASLLPTILHETQKLRNYQYLCNEQLASKLKGLLTEKRARAFLKEPFKWDRNVERIIKKLQENRRADGTWGWWQDTGEELWISLHATEALLEAQELGYNTNLDKQKLIDLLIYRLESYKGADKLSCLQILKKLDAKVNYQKYCDTLDRRARTEKNPSKYDQFRLILLKQQAGITVSLDSVLMTMRHTMFGNIYWGEENYRFFDNSIQLSVLAYQILRNEGKHPELLQKIRGYFLEQRHTGDWRNTYETSLILGTVLPDVLVESGGQVKPSTLTLSGAKNETVAKFPYTSTFTGDELNVAKTGALPVYITGYQQFWNKNPEKVSKDFTVETWFEKKGDKITRLKGGEAVQLKAEVKVKGDADYVMVNIPIPAGCSYESKDQYWQNETHREYFKDRVSIFSRKLKEGKYTFTVELMPRYGGVYHLNPAKAEMMYFPVFYGREGMKKMTVE